MRQANLEMSCFQIFDLGLQIEGCDKTRFHYEDILFVRDSSIRIPLIPLSKGRQEGIMDLFQIKQRVDGFVVSSYFEVEVRP